MSAKVEAAGAAAELLAPAGQPDAAHAAFHYGADAIYLGLDRFSARAEAVNFTPDQLDETVAYAHSLSPKRRVYLALNTLVQEHELPGAIESLAVAAEARVDAVIVQDLGVARIARERFPSLALHASTQLAIHNPEGVRAAKALGFSRVTLARELTLDELREIARIAAIEEIETEVFIHGTLCYSYSGLCLFSSIASGRSGNRGRCVYSCREAIRTPSGPVHPFSLKDLALGTRVADLSALGITSLKIEGRKKSPLYVAATVDHYRRILDGDADPGAVAAREARLKTIFARPWTTLFLDSRRNPEAADPDVVGHRGAPLAGIGRIAPSPAGPAVFLTPSLPVERHDGLQIDLPGVSRPYGLPVDTLYAVGAEGRLESVFAAPAGQPVAVALPEDAPIAALVPGLPVYQASSQAVKRSFPFDKPRPGAYGSRLDMDVALRFAPGSADGACRVDAEARLAAPDYMTRPGDPPLTAGIRLDAPSFPARDAEGAELAARNAFSRTGGSRFSLRDFRLDNPDRIFVKQGALNQARRDLLALLEDRLRRRREHVLRLFAAPAEASAPRAPSPAEQPAAPPGWIVLVDSASVLDAFGRADFEGLDEAVVSLRPDAPARDQTERVDALSRSIGREKIRIALPLILRGGERTRTPGLVDAFAGQGWNKWLLPNLGSIGLIGQSRFARDPDLAADWPLYALNSRSVEQLLALGFSSFTLSPEDDADNCRDLLSRHADAARVIVYADLPLFLSAVCAHAQMGQCRDAATPGQCRHRTAPTLVRMEKTGAASVRSLACGSVVFGPEPFSLARRLGVLSGMGGTGGMGAKRLCVDLRWRDHDPDSALAVWRSVRNGEAAGGTEGNFFRGLA